METKEDGKKTGKDEKGNLQSSFLNLKAFKKWIPHSADLHI